MGSRTAPIPDKLMRVAGRLTGRMREEVLVTDQAVSTGEGDSAVVIDAPLVITNSVPLFPVKCLLPPCDTTHNTNHGLHHNRMVVTALCSG